MDKVLQHIRRLRIASSVNATVSGGAFLAVPHASRGQGGAGELVDLALGFLLRQYLVILFLLLGVAGAIFLIVRAPTYTAQAKIFIGTQRAQFIQQQSLFADVPLDPRWRISSKSYNPEHCGTRRPKT